MPDNNNNREVIKQGACQFVLFEAVSSKGNRYTAVKIIVNGYEYPKPLFLTDIEKELLLTKC